MTVNRDVFMQELIKRGIVKDTNEDGEPSLSEQLDSLNVVKSIVNPVTGGIDLIGPGGEVIPVGGGGTTLVAKLNSGSQLKACVIGNSISAAAGRMFDRLRVLSGDRIVLISNASVPGRALQLVVQNMAADINPLADIVFISEGSNSAVNGVSPGGEYAYMKQAVDYVVSIGKICIVCGSPPRSSNPAYLPRTNRYPWAEYLAALDGGGIFVDPYYKWRGTDGAYMPGYSSDATHPAVERQDLYDMAGEEIWAAINPWTTGQKKPYMEVISNNDNAGYSGLDNSANFVPYGNALLTNGYVGWSTTDAAKTALSVAAAAPFRGNKLVIDFNAGVSSTAVKVSRSYLNNASSSKPAIGDNLLVKAVVECTQNYNAAIAVSLKSPNGFSEAVLVYISDVIQAQMFGSYVTVGGNANADTQILVSISKRANIVLTATGSGTNLTVSVVSTSAVPIGCTIAGSGIPAGTKIISQTSGTPGGAGVYVTDQATTASASAVDVLATGMVSISNADIYNLTKLRSGSGYV